MRFRRVDLIVNPANRLRDADPAPLVVLQQAQSLAVAGEVLSRHNLEQAFGQDHMAVLVLVITVPV